MAKAILNSINRQIVDEYSQGNITQNKLALKFGVSQSHVFRILKSNRSSLQSSAVNLEMKK